MSEARARTGERGRLLVVEDKAASRETLCRYVAQLGHVRLVLRRRELAGRAGNTYGSEAFAVELDGHRDAPQARAALVVVQRVAPA